MALSPFSRIPLTGSHEFPRKSPEPRSAERAVRGEEMKFKAANLAEPPEKAEALSRATTGGELPRGLI